MVYYVHVYAKERALSLHHSGPRHWPQAIKYGSETLLASIWLLYMNPSETVLHWICWDELNTINKL